MKKILFAFILVLMTTSLFSQEVKDAQKQISKLDSFESKTGVLVKVIRYSLPDLKLVDKETAILRIRKIIIGDEIEYFFQIRKRGKETVSIAYEDLLELIKSIESLKNDSASDLALNPDYLENKFVTDDGLSFGYYIKNGEIKWFLGHSSYGSGSTIYFKNVSDIETSFITAKLKMDELKK